MRKIGDIAVFAIIMLLLLAIGFALGREVYTVESSEPLQSSYANGSAFVTDYAQPAHYADAANFYPQAFTNTFFSVYGRRSEQPRHIVNNVARTGKHNVRIETVFSKIKDRTTDFRGLKALWSAPILMAGIVLQHNFIEAHTTTGRIPAELAGIKIETGANRWLGMIQKSSLLPY